MSDYSSNDKPLIDKVEIYDFPINIICSKKLEKYIRLLEVENEDENYQWMNGVLVYFK